MATPTVVHRHGQRYLLASVDYDTCPVCRGRIVRTCRCFLADSECERGHQWHYQIEHFRQPNERRTLVLGPAHH